MAKAGWIVSGGFFGFSMLALTSIGVAILPLALAGAALLALKRIRGGWLFVVAAGTTFSLAWLSLVLDPNAPESSPLPVVSGALVALVAWVFYRRSAAEVSDHN